MIKKNRVKLFDNIKKRFNFENFNSIYGKNSINTENFNLFQFKNEHIFITNENNDEEEEIFDFFLLR